MAARLRLVAIAVLVIGFALFLASSREPSYQGKTLTAWLQQDETAWVQLFDFQTNREPKDSAAEAAIRHFGSEGPPIFLQLLTTRESPLRVKLASWFPPPLIRVFHIPSAIDYTNSAERQRGLGAFGFAALGPDAKPYVPSIIALLHDPNPGVRHLAAFTLRRLGPTAAQALPDMIKCLNDPDWFVRDEAMREVRQFSRNPALVTAIMMLQNDTNQFSRLQAIEVLRAFGTNASAAPR